LDFEVLRFDGRALRGPDEEIVTWPDLAVLGDPVAHSLSPALHTAALAERGIDARYRAVHVRADDLEAALADAAEAGVRGLNLTLPHKASAIDLCNYVSDEVHEIGATNTLVRHDTDWRAHNTDARGLALALQSWRGRRLSRSLGRVVVLGAGGAARAAVVCARALGARRIEVHARTPDRARWAEEFGAVVRPLDSTGPLDASLVLQCTPLGLDPDHDPSPVAVDALAHDAIAVDTTYADRPSAFLRDAAARRVESIDGRGMLVGQAALAFSMWFGAQPPLETMARAIGLSS